MSDTLLTTGLIVLAQDIAGDLVQQVNYNSVALKTLQCLEGEGQNWAWAARGGGVLTESFNEGADAVNFGSATQDLAKLDWARYRSNMHVSDSARAMARTARSPFANQNLWVSEMINAAAALSSTINAEVYSGAGTINLISGLADAIGDDTNTYATIDRSDPTKAFWKPYVVDSAASALTFKQIRTDLAGIYKKCGQRPDLAFVTPDTLNLMASLFDPQKQYLFSVLPVGRDVTTKAGKKFTLEGGVGAIEFDGCIFVEDKDCTANTIYYINTQYVKFRYLPFDMAVLGMSDEEMQMIGNDGLEQIGIPFQLQGLAKTGDSEKAMMKSYLQLVVSRPDACGTRLNIAP